MKKISKKTFIIVFLFLFCIGLGAPILADAKNRYKPAGEPAQSAAKNPIVTGLIESVSSDSIVVLGKRYFITGVPLVWPSGELAARDELKFGAKVSLFFKDRAIISILVYEYLPE